MGLDGLLHATTSPLICLLAFFSQDDKGYRNLSSTFIGFTDDTYILYEWMLKEMTLEFSRADLESLYGQLIRKLSDRN